MDSLQSVYNFVFEPVLGESGYALAATGQPFEIKWVPDEATSWFGPLGILIVIPAVVWALWRDKGSSRLMAFTAGCVTLALCYKLGWSPHRCRFFTLPIVCTAPCVALFLKEMRVRLWTLQGIRLLCLVLICYACLFNVLKPVIISQTSTTRTYSITTQDIWSLSSWGQDRLAYENYYTEGRVDTFSSLVPADKTVAFIGYDRYFQFMFRNPQLTFLPMKAVASGSLLEVENRLEQADYLLCMNRSCDVRELNLDLELIWAYEKNERRYTELYKIDS